MDKNTETHLNKRKQLSKQKYEEFKTRLPIKNMLYKDDPPSFITLVGSKGSGKSTIINSIIKKFTNTSIMIKGPITLTSSRDKRITLFECDDNIHQFVDTSKISDMVIFVINATIGLECGTLEYLSLLVSQGLPKIMFIVTFVDKNNDKKMFKKIKKQIYSEICSGLKFFYLKMNNNKYDESEMLNLIRFIGSMKYRPVEWKCTHPHIVVDKIDEDHVYGYVRGGVFSKGANVYIPGFMENIVVNFEILNDPVPIKEDRLSKRQKLVYAPMTFIEKVVVEETSTLTNFEVEQVEKIKLFKNSGITLQNKIHDDKLDFKEPVKEEIIHNEESSSTEKEFNDIEDLKQLVKNKFKKEAENEEDYIKNFNLKYTENKTDMKDNLIFEKHELESKKQINEENKLRDLAYPGEYIKIKLKINIPMNVDFTKIIILGIILNTENKSELLQGKFKKSKWLHKLLKTNDPLIFSVGWRRFQSIPVYSSKTSGDNRMLKYCFKQGYSLINFYGSIVPPGTGFVAYSESLKFRVIGHGKIQDVSGEVNLVKKLKLIGYPFKIMGNTAFIKDMFTSNLEVHKFKDAKIKTVSGLKGLIKNPIGKKGDFRGAFEGEMLLSDIVVMKCFVPFPVQKIMISVDNLLQNWTGLRSLKEIRRENNIEIKDKYIEEVSDDLSNKKHEDFELPEEIESKLPFDKRKINIINNKIELPVAPEEEEFLNFKQKLKQKRKEKEEQIKYKEFIESEKLNKEINKIQEEKKDKLIKSILKSKKIKNKKR